MANVWDYDSQGSSINADNLSHALMNAILAFEKAENESNQEGGTPSQLVSYQITGTNEKTFAATVTLPARLVVDPADGRPKLKARNILSEFLTDYDPGSGTLASCATLPEALVKLAELNTYWERQIQATIVTRTPNQTLVAEDIENSQYTITANIPCAIHRDPATG